MSANRQASSGNSGLLLRWKKPSEELPKVDGLVVAVYSPDAMLSDIWPAKWNMNNQTFSAGGAWFELDEVELWVEMPPLPMK